MSALTEEGVRPDLSIVMPGVKEALTGAAVAEIIPFLAAVSVTAHEDGGGESAAPALPPAPAAAATGPVLIPGVRDTRYFDGVLSGAECAALVSRIAASEHLSFWSSDEGRRESARLFRDADTIEVDSPEFAKYMWDKIQPLLDNKTITIGNFI
jgi:hypothetical protein